jgi:hypothetical protein
VVGAGLGLAALAAGLALAFGAWRGRQRALAEFGAREVAPLVEPLAEAVPPGVGPAQWRRTVESGRALLVALAASGALERPALERLAGELRARVAGATPGRSAGVLGGIWTDLEDRAGPVLTRARRFDLASSLHDLARRAPPGLGAEDWALAVVTTRAMLVRASDPSRMSAADRRALHERLVGRLGRVGAGEEAEALADVWAIVGGDRPGGFDRPAILAGPGLSAR